MNKLSELKKLADTEVEELICRSGYNDIEFGLYELQRKNIEELRKSIEIFNRNSGILSIVMIALTIGLCIIAILQIKVVLH